MPTIVRSTDYLAFCLVGPYVFLLSVVSGSPLLPPPATRLVFKLDETVPGRGVLGLVPPTLVGI